MDCNTSDGHPDPADLMLSLYGGIETAGWVFQHTQDCQTVLILPIHEPSNLGRNTPEPVFHSPQGVIPPYLWPGDMRVWKYGRESGESVNADYLLVRTP